MPEQRRYATAAALRQALEARLKTVSLEDAVDLQRLRRQVAFDRFLARLCAVPSRDWVLKGGYAMELRFVAARSTKDLDFTLRSGDGNSALDQLQRAGALDIGDFFTFRVGEAMMDLDAAPYGGARYPVDALMDGRVFVKFHIDVGIGDVILDPLETVATRDWLGFGEIPPPFVAMIAREQQFAEKVHAYTLPRTNANSRVRDIVDLLLLVESGSLDAVRTREALRHTFERRSTHELPTTLIPPPSEWEKPFLVLAEECRIEVGLQAAFDIVLLFWSNLHASD
jgi:hypothetical protein